MRAQERCPRLPHQNSGGGRGDPRAPPGNIQHQVFRSTLVPRPQERHQSQQTIPQAGCRALVCPHAPTQEQGWSGHMG